MTTVLVFLDQTIVRIPILVLTTPATSENLYTLWHAKTQNRSGVDGYLVMTTSGKRQSLFVPVASLATLAIVAFEIIAYMILH